MFYRRIRGQVGHQVKKLHVHTVNICIGSVYRWLLDYSFNCRKGIRSDIDFEEMPSLFSLNKELDDKVNQSKDLYLKLIYNSVAFFFYEPQQE